MKTKTCSKCKRELPVGQFWKDKSRTDGLTIYCKRCNHEFYTANKKRISQRDFIRSHGFGLLYKKFIMAAQNNGYIGKFGDSIIGVSKGIIADAENELLPNAYSYLLKAF